MNESIPHTTEEPLSKAPNPQLLHSAAAKMIAHYSVCVCVFTTHCCVCALGWGNAEHKF